MADINIRAEAGVVRMRMGDDRARNGAPGVDMKVARGAIETAFSLNNEVQGCARRGIQRVISIWGWPRTGQLDPTPLLKIGP